MRGETMAAHTTAAGDARALFGEAMLGPEDVARVLGTEPARLAAADPAVLSAVPYDLPTLRAAHGRGHLLVFRTPTDGAAPLTAKPLLERLPGAIQAKLM